VITDRLKKQIEYCRITRVQKIKPVSWLFCEVWFASDCRVFFCYCRRALQETFIQRMLIQ